MIGIKDKDVCSLQAGDSRRPIGVLVSDMVKAALPVDFQTCLVSDEFFNCPSEFLLIERPGTIVGFNHIPVCVPPLSPSPVSVTAHLSFPVMFSRPTHSTFVLKDAFMYCPRYS